MPALTTAIAAIGVGASIAGTAMSVSAASTQAKNQAAAAAEQRYVISPLQQQVVGKQQEVADLNTKQTLDNYNTQVKTLQTEIDATNKIGDLQDTGYDLQRQVAGIQMQAATLDATRQLRQNVRDSLSARSTAIASAAHQGGSGFASSSGLAGGEGEISGISGTNATGITQNLGAASKLYKTNLSLLDTNQQINTLNRQTSLNVANLQIGSAERSAGTYLQGAGVNSQISDLYKQITAAGGDISGFQQAAAAAGGQAAFGAGLSSLGGATITNLKTIKNIGTEFAGTGAVPSASFLDHGFSWG